MKPCAPQCAGSTSGVERFRAGLPPRPSPTAGGHVQTAIGPEPSLAHPLAVRFERRGGHRDGAGGDAGHKNVRASRRELTSEVSVLLQRRPRHQQGHVILERVLLPAVGETFESNDESKMLLTPGMRRFYGFRELEKYTGQALSSSHRHWVELIHRRRLSRTPHPTLERLLLHLQAFVHAFLNARDFRVGHEIRLRPQAVEYAVGHLQPDPTRVPPLRRLVDPDHGVVAIYGFPKGAKLEQTAVADERARAPRFRRTSPVRRRPPRSTVAFQPRCFLGLKTSALTSTTRL